MLELFISALIKTLTNRREEDVGDGDGGDDAYGICDECAGYCVTSLLDANRTEVYGDNVEGGVGGTLEHTAQAASKTIGT